MLHPICQKIWKTQQWSQGWTSSVSIPIPQKGHAKEGTNYCTILFISHACKVALEVHELRPFRCTSWVQKRQKNQISNGQHLLNHLKSKRVPENHLLCFIDYAKAFDCVDHNKLWKILKEMGIPDHLTCLLRNLYTGHEATELDMEQQIGSK